MATLQTLPDATTLLPAGASPGSGSFAVRAFLYAVFKHRRLVLGVFLLVFIASAVAAFIRPSVWTAKSKVMVKIGETVQLAPAETPSKSVGMPLSQEVVNTEAEIVKSREVITEAVRRLGIQPEEGTSMNELIDKLQLGLAVQPTPSSNVLQITYLGRYPDRAARMVNTITDVYIEKHNAAYQSTGVHSFYRRQLGILGHKMKVAQRRYRRFLQRERIVDVEQEVHLLNQDLIEQQKGLDAHRGKIRGVERKIENVKDTLSRTPQSTTHAEEYVANPAIQTYKDKLAQLEIEKANLLQAYLPADRHVVDKEDEITSIKNRLKQEEQRILAKQLVQENENYKELERNLMTLQTLREDLLAREPSLASRVDALQRRLLDLRDKRFVVANMKQDADNAAYAYDLYRKKGEEARISEEMKNQSMVNVSVVERATPPTTPDNGMLLPLLLGVVGGLGLAASMAVIVEYLNRRLRFEEEIERYIELPVLAVIPDLETTVDIATA